MNTSQIFLFGRSGFAALLAALALGGCGSGSGGSGGNAPSSATDTSAPAPEQGVTIPQQGATAPVLTNNIATDGRNWINYRRAQIGIPQLVRNRFLDAAAQAHSDYQKTNNVIVHDEIAGKVGFTGADLLARLAAAKYEFAGSGHAGEVISATSSASGFYMADELITAIYHRFVIFEPTFKEIGTGSATTRQNYTYFTTNFTGDVSSQVGIGRGNAVTWPVDGQVGVAPNFFSNTESPDPVADRNEVGYPVSIHGNNNAILTVTKFTLRPRGGNDIAVKLLASGVDVNMNTPSAAAIVPLLPLRAATTYDVSFSGKADSLALNKTWSFKTK